jgi:hypothetical protein
MLGYRKTRCASLSIKSRRLGVTAEPHGFRVWAMRGSLHVTYEPPLCRHGMLFCCFVVKLVLCKLAPVWQLHLL